MREETDTPRRPSRDAMRLAPYSPVTTRRHAGEGRFTTGFDERVRLAMQRFPKRLPDADRRTPPAKP